MFFEINFLHLMLVYFFALQKGILTYTLVFLFGISYFQVLKKLEMPIYQHS